MINWNFGNDIRPEGGIIFNDGSTEKNNIKYYKTKIDMCWYINLQFHRPEKKTDCSCFMPFDISM